MMNEPNEVAAVLAGTPLADLPTGHGPRGTILVRDVPPGNLLEAWRAAHTLVPVTGRWPVMTSAWGEWLEVRPHPDPAAPSESDLSVLDQTARTMDPWQRFQRWNDFSNFFNQPASADTVRGVARGYSGVDLTDEALRQLKLPTTAQVLLHWLSERVLSDPDLKAQVLQCARYAVQTDHWHTPGDVSLLLLPTASPWLAPKWVSFWGALGQDEELAAVLWQWYHQWGAQLVASWGTMLQLIVDRPPPPGAPALTVAGQILTLGHNLAMDIWELAVGLPEGDGWFIHHRP